MQSASQEVLLDSLIELLNRDDFKKDFVKKLNDNVDIPIINEKTEKKMINALYKLMVKQVEEAAEKVKNN
tara:strand:- start:317 stop:526 length:210 start_codon:yes stop_codon:yes gene_type:complete